MIAEDAESISKRIINQPKLNALVDLDSQNIVDESCRVFVFCDKQEMK